ncbi:MAG: S1 RNA-binding domain-containing protein [Anaerolineales bacterium]|nr:S1 RNA-binding domain-containing protein [Anaerolineales bacterium]
MDQNDKLATGSTMPGERPEIGEHPMHALLDAESYELETPQRGEIRTGTIARVSENDILVDVGAKSEGIILGRELDRLSEEERSGFEVGDEIQVYVVRSADRDGTILLSISRAEEEQDWQQAEEYMESQEPYEGLIDGYNKGGLIVKLGRLRGFVPASQVSISRRRRSDGETPDDRWGDMVGEPIITRVIEVDQRRNRLILSERAASREARDALKERLISELQPGEVRQGTVISLADFGAFVDIGGADGLIHISELSWKRIENPSEILEVGQEIDVKVLNVDAERKRISLSLRDLASDPWDKVMKGFEEGQLVEGTITKLTKFGAFAALKGTEEYEIEGLIHISELSDDHIEHPREVLQEGQDVAMRLIKIDDERRRIGLSLKQVDSAEFADVDWRTAMEDIEAEAIDGIEVTPADESPDAEEPQEELEVSLELEEGAEPQTDLPPEPEGVSPDPGEEQEPEGSQE